MTKHFKLLFVGIVCTFILTPAYKAEAFPFLKKKKRVELTTSKDSVRNVTPYDKIFKGKKNVITKKSVITIHKIEDKIYLEMGKELFGRQFLVSSHVTKASDVDIFYPGMEAAASQRYIIEKTDSMVLFRQQRYNVYVEKENSNIENALVASRLSSVIKAFPIAAFNNDSTAVIFDATSYFSGSNKDILDIKGLSAEETVISNVDYQSNMSYINDVEAYSRNVSVNSEITMKLTLTSRLIGLELTNKPELTVGITTSLTLLDQDKMPVRLADARIGTGYYRFTKFNADGGTKNDYFASRWKLEPKDPEALKRGGTSEPVKPIIIYVDTLFKETWYEAIKKGIEAWNPLFEKAGFHDAIVVKRYLPDHTTFFANDPMNSCIRFGHSTSSNVITSRLLTDPRTGEILSANITVPRDYAFGVRRLAVYQISEIDSRYQNYFLPDDAICEALTCSIMRQMGLSLGLTPNMAGSAAYSVEQLRNPQFTRQYGITASVTDNVMFNIAAMPGDKEKGVATIVSKPGVYDEFAIKWLYTPVYENERDTLNKWLVEKSGDPRYFYGKRQSSTLVIDPRSISNDLGSDVFKSYDNAISHLKYVADNAGRWLANDDIPTSYRDLFPDFVYINIRNYLTAISYYIGGIYLNERREGTDIPSYKSVSKETQKKALKKILEIANDFSWTDKKDFVALGGLNNNHSDMFYYSFPIRVIMPRIAKMSLSVDKSENPYSQKEALDDVSAYLFKDIKIRREIEPKRFSNLGYYINTLIGYSPVMTANYKKAKANGVSLIEPLTEINMMTSGQEFEALCYLKIIEAKQYLQQGLNYCKDEYTRNRYRYYISLINLAIENN
jgi:hypothetical protein